MPLSFIQNTKPETKTFAAFGEIMLRFSPFGMERFFQSNRMMAVFGGGESNVMVSLAIQGCSSRFITALPDNEIGIAATRFLQSFGVDVSRIIMKKNSRMGLYFMEKGANQRPSRVIYDRDDSAINQIADGEIDWEKALQGCGWFHITGITPALSQNAANQAKKSIEIAKKLGLIVSMDLNYRAKLWKYGASPQEIMQDLVKNTDIIIANEEDCQKTLGIGTEIDPETGKIDQEQYAKLTQQVLDQYSNVKMIAITLRESVSASHNRWGACINDRKEVIFSRKYDITHIVDRVGGGDSFSAGLIYGLSHLPSVKEALEYAVAASCLTHSIEGDVNLSSKNEIMNLYQGDVTGRIKR